jgi:predicted RND superfamily exporter protein
MHRTHQSTGLAMFYTSLVISFGFLVLVLSNFIPSIYFGIFTAIAMMTALLVNLTLLPKLLIWLKPKLS